jgi:hypothetical protein
VRGETLVISGDRWTIVDVAPAVQLAEMVAVILEEEGLSALICTLEEGETKAPTNTRQVEDNYVLVPEEDADKALEIIKDSVTDYRGDQLEELLQGLSPDDLDE